MLEGFEEPQRLANKQSNFKRLGRSPPGKASELPIPGHSRGSSRESILLERLGYPPSRV